MTRKNRGNYDFSVIFYNIFPLLCLFLFNRKLFQEPSDRKIARILITSLVQVDCSSSAKVDHALDLYVALKKLYEPFH